ncbi:hypothetical protein ACIGZH_01805 [Streptomyces sp. NPDC058319]|uniref:hypothetical protein n=1 Tax=unclassified Streptomyces TaxID=2593676 RepID=UPI0036ED6A6A
MTQLSPDARAVVRAADALTTQVRRIADAVSSGTCDASTLGVSDRHLGPCLLRADHDGPVHRGPEGETWATVVRVADDDATTPAATCSAQYRGPDYLATECIRAAQHQHPQHTDSGGFHWSDALAVYPASEGQQTESPAPADRPAVTVHGDPDISPAAREALGALVDVAVRQMTGDPAADDTVRFLRRESLLVLLTRLQRGRPLSEEEAGTLRHHVETEIREANTARADLEQAQAAIERVRAVARDWGPTTLPHSEAHRLLTDLTAALDLTEQPTTTKEN